MIKIHSILVRPQHSSKTVILDPGADVPSKGELYALLENIYDQAEKNSTTIKFLMSEDGKQDNQVRSELLAYATNPSLEIANPLAERLAKATDGRSGTGLLFLMVGNIGSDIKVVLSRFPADSGILAEQGTSGLKIEFLKRIFMKSSKLYKSVSFQGTNYNGSFWIGQAIDKQNSDAGLTSSKYWISSFLMAEFKTTAELGTKRLAEAMRDAAKLTDNVLIKHEISSIATLTNGITKRIISPKSYLTLMNASEETKAAVKSAFKKEHLWDESFVLDKSTFKRKLAYKMVELDNGAQLVAATDNFDEIFTIEEINSDVTRFSTEGSVVDEKLKGQKQ